MLAQCGISKVTIDDDRPPAHLHGKGNPEIGTDQGLSVLLIRTGDSHDLGRILDVFANAYLQGLELLADK